MSRLGKWLMFGAFLLGGAGLLTSRTWLLLAAVGLLVAFILTWMYEELWPHDPWRKYKKRSPYDP